MADEEQSPQVVEQPAADPEEALEGFGDDDVAAEAPAAPVEPEAAAPAEAEPAAPGEGEGEGEGEGGGDEAAVAAETVDPASEPQPAAEDAEPAEAAGAPADPAPVRKSVEDLYAEEPAHIAGETDDLATLTNLTEDTLLEELTVRYASDTIYTFVSDILIAVNPFKQLPIYTEEVAKQYNSCVPTFVKPHVWVVADACFNNLFKMKMDQCAVISGESGAGKTESAKLIIKHIIRLCEQKGGQSGLEQQIIDVSPILEAFGNAQTTMNDNSSRFGKYTRLLFQETGAVMGAQLSEYLLEKSRVMEQDPGERNFHILYYLFADAELREKYKLTEIKDFNCLCGELWDDNEVMFKEVLTALKTVGFVPEEEEMIFAVLATILHLSNVEFEGNEESKVKQGDKGSAALEIASGLLGVDADKLAAVLTTSVNVTRGETIVRHYKVPQAYDCRDALAKCLYSNLFGWIVTRLNENLAPELHMKKMAGGRPGAAQRVKPAFEIGVLDIFGFENFKTNSFEQVCINLAHEQLQYFFNRHTFKLELEEYAKEGIDVEAITFKDNMALIDMFMGKPVGILSLLDEECTFPKASDQSFVDKIEKAFVGHDSYSKPEKSRGYPAFGIQHFAGVVEYNATNFLEKNRDNLAGGIVELMQDSAVALVADVFGGEVLATGQIRAREKSASRTRRGEVVKAPEESGNKVHRKTPSLSSQFKTSLSQLIDRMTACYPHFVRCIKPNLNQEKENFVPEFVRTQLRYTGVLEATRIRQEGFSWRPTFSEFVKRYKILAFDTSKLSLVKETAMSAERIIKAANIGPYHVGTSKLFLKFYHVADLERAIQKYFNNVVKTQSQVRMHLQRNRFRKKLERKRMSEAERAEAEAKEAAERKERDALEAERTKAEAAIAEQKAAEALALKEIKELEQKNREQELLQIQAQQEAEMEALARAAAEARAEKAKLEAEAKSIKRERQKSQKVRKEQAEKIAEEARARAEAESKAHEEHLAAKEKIESTLKAEKQALEKKERELLEKLQKAEEEAREVKQKAEEEAARAAKEKEEEMLRLEQERKEDELAYQNADWRREEHDLRARAKELCGISSTDVVIDQYTARGWVKKLGSQRKNWHKRWFVLDLKDRTVKYYATEKSRKEKNGFLLEDLERCFIPAESKSTAFGKNKVADKKFIFICETAQRTFYCQALTEGSQRIWQTLLGSIGDFNEALNNPGHVGLGRGAGSSRSLASLSPRKGPADAPAAAPAE